MKVLKIIKPKTKLSEKQIECITMLRKYDCMIMHDGWVTGGHGYFVNKATQKSLEHRGLIIDGKLTEIAKVIDLV